MTQHDITPVPERPNRSFQMVSDEFARAYELGALAALDFIADEWPDMAEDHDDTLAPTMQAAEHIGRVIDAMLGRS